MLFTLGDVEPVTDEHAERKFSIAMARCSTTRASIPESTDAELVETWIRQDGRFLTTSIISVFRKTRANPAYEALIADELHTHRVPVRPV
jgi:hypothetical protein